MGTETHTRCTREKLLKMNTPLCSLLSVLIAATFAATANEEQCRTFAGGNVYPDERKLGVEHALHWSKAQISKPAPFWEGKAVVNGEFKDLKLTDFKGKYLVFFFYPLDFTFV